MNTINYHQKSIKIALEKNEWKNLQSKILLENLQKQQKATPQQLLKQSIDNVIQNQIDKLKEEIEKETNSKNIYNPVPPTVNIFKGNENELEFELIFCYYKLEELVNLKHKDLTNEFFYQEIDLNKMNQAFEHFINNYPIFKDINSGKVEKNDLVEITYQTTKAEKIITPWTTIQLEAKKKNDSFNINELLIDKEYGQTFEVNDPTNVHWIIKINNGQRKEYTQISNENIKLVKIKEIKNIDDLKKRLIQDYSMDHASSQLLRYYKHIIFEIGKVNIVKFSNSNLEYEMTNLIKKNQHLIPNHLLNKTLAELTNENNPQLKHFLIQVENNAKFALLTRLIEFLITRTYQITISEEEAKIAYEHIMATNISDHVLTVNDMANVLHTQKIALVLAKYNNPQIYDKISQDLKLTI
ncbi:trigger factor-related chaperone [Mycoplasma sp. 1018B]|uniref:trigger factor-related chaperone n=1 Tax=Mycoplasma sp. 1018B TaxID=2967302 RepID=UPI00211C8097|nr:hypothetical protein [Mycoplasma sp. 1018B]UUM19410.1 hypothetical protein NPA14_00865 [Mycoplasma sp. 1018B]